VDGRGTVTSCGGDRGVGVDVALGVVDAVHSTRARYRRRLPREEEPSDGFDDDAVSDEYRLSSSFAAREEMRDVHLKRGAAAFISDVILVRVRKVKRKILICIPYCSIYILPLSLSPSFSLSLSSILN
jgi:hypothetical protein